MQKKYRFRKSGTLLAIKNFSKYGTGVSYFTTKSIDTFQDEP